MFPAQCLDFGGANPARNFLNRSASFSAKRKGPASFSHAPSLTIPRSSSLNSSNSSINCALIPRAGALPLNFLHALRIRRPDFPSSSSSTADSASSAAFSGRAIVQIEGNPTEGPNERDTLAKIPSIVPICSRCIRCVIASSTSAHSAAVGSLFAPGTVPN